MNELKPLFYEFDDFSVDTGRRLLLRGGAPISHTPKVFDTLVVFLENRGEIVSKDTLMQELWSDSFVEEANIAQNVAVLRRALGEKAKENKFLVTIPGRGYRFVADVKAIEGRLSQNG
jgi:DNA-binding winged helix-turn-helix (wHTH) protein